MESHAAANLARPRSEGSGRHFRNAAAPAGIVRAPNTGSERYLRSAVGSVAGRLPSASVFGAGGDEVACPLDAARLPQPTPSATTVAATSRTEAGGPGSPRALRG